jgi:hypothetical protein
MVRRGRRPDRWKNPETKEEVRSFTIIVTSANAFLSQWRKKIELGIGTTHTSSLSW